MQVLLKAVPFIDAVFPNCFRKETSRCLLDTKILQPSDDSLSLKISSVLLKLIYRISLLTEMEVFSLMFMCTLLV